MSVFEKSIFVFSTKVVYFVSCRTERLFYRVFVFTEGGM